MEPIHVDSLRRWSHRYASTEQDEEHDSKSRFPVHSELNARLILWHGELYRLHVDAIVNVTNESMTDRTGLCGRIMELAGRELEAECSTTEPCRTGEARITHGFALPAKHIIHTVGPRFNIKYRTAAENALHNCYWNCLQVLKEAGLSTIAFTCINSERKGYPRESAAHIAIRTIRRFLEHHGSGISTIVLAMDSASDMEIYQRVLPLYFPRTKEEEAAAITLLPEDTGNELGETVSEERAIRISTLPGMRDDDDAAATVVTAAGPAAGSPVRAADTEDFKGMRGDADSQRISRTVDDKALAQLESERLYQRYLRRARTEDLRHIEALNLIYRAGNDQRGRPIFVFVASHLPARAVNLEHVLLFLILTMDEVVEKDYVLVYLHSMMNSSHQPPFSWIRKVYRVFNRKYKKNLKSLFIVHPTFWLKFMFILATPFVSSKFWRKLTYIDRLYDLSNYLDYRQLNIPPHIVEHDRKLHGVYTSTSTRPHDTL